MMEMMVHDGDAKDGGDGGDTTDAVDGVYVSFGWRTSPGPGVVLHAAGCGRVTRSVIQGLGESSSSD